MSDHCLEEMLPMVLRWLARHEEQLRALASTQPQSYDQLRDARIRADALLGSVLSDLRSVLPVEVGEVVGRLLMLNLAVWRLDVLPERPEVKQ
jgi:hypothetical protein